jgi:hypothetical protein
VKRVDNLTWEQADKLSAFDRWRWKRARRHLEYVWFLAGAPGPWFRTKDENDRAGVYKRGWRSPA